ncbi:EF-hand domain-containing protein [Pseudodesulfovibrio piezophilus]|nr:EF-hand domain-containing protein [Pseudodesulfovibrio piezophilus]
MPLLTTPSMAAESNTNYNVRFASLDVNSDGFMAKSEFIVAFSNGDMAVFATADSNKDGSVSREEWERFKTENKS